MMLAGHLRALQREMRSGFELITNKLLTAIERLNNRLDVLVDRQSISDRRIDDHERRLAALETKAMRRKPAKRK
jgi:hypothetical protein